MTTVALFFSIKPRFSGIFISGICRYFYFMLKYGITGFIFVAIIVSGYFLLSYKLDTIIVYDRQAAYINVGNSLSIKPDIIVENDQELSVSLNFENIQDTARINDLVVDISSPLKAASASNGNCRDTAASFRELPANCKRLLPGNGHVYPSLTFAFSTHNLSKGKYLVSINGSIISGTDTIPSSFRKLIPIEGKRVFRDRNGLF